MGEARVNRHVTTTGIHLRTMSKKKGGKNVTCLCKRNSALSCGHKLRTTCSRARLSCSKWNMRKIPHYMDRKLRPPATWVFPSQFEQHLQSPKLTKLFGTAILQHCCEMNRELHKTLKQSQSNLKCAWKKKEEEEG